jgi:hypothetical protein
MFSVYAAVAVTLNFIYHITFFVAIMAYAADAEHNSTHSLFLLRETLSAEIRQEEENKKRRNG